MELGKETRKNITVVRLQGDFDVTTVKVFNDYLQNEMKTALNIALDFEGVMFVDSSAIGSVVNLLSKLRQKNGKLFIFSLNESVQETFNTAKLGNFLDIITKKEFDRMFPENDYLAGKLRRYGIL